MKKPITKIELDRIVNHSSNFLYTESQEWFVATFRQLKGIGSDELYIRRFDDVKDSLDYYLKLEENDLLGLMNGNVKIISGIIKPDAIRISQMKKFKTEDFKLMTIKL
tara:strand:+ start:525 stop:848 length:324 start_codon:yes stop_codon:yes gene_type:complete